MLAYPGKVITDSAGSVWIADTGHHRVLGADAAGQVHTIIGSGQCGHADGPLATAELHSPQGMALDAAGQVLYVADAGTHVIRRVDLARGLVRTLAGNGRLGSVDSANARGPWLAQQVSLCAPWDVALDEQAGRLYVAMAGAQQIWVIDVAAPPGSETSETAAVLAGSGLARPSGLALSSDRRRLYVANSDSSAVCVIELEPGAESLADQPGHVTTLVSVGTGLSAQGTPASGQPGPETRLPHSMGIALTPSGLVVTDAGALRGINPRHGTVTTVWPSGGAIQLHQPGGVAFDRTTRTYIVADTNHHRLVRVARDAASAAEIQLVLPASGPTY